MNKYGLPYNVLRDPNSWDKAPRDPITIGSFIFSTLQIQTFYWQAIWLTGFVTQTLGTKLLVIQYLLVTLFLLPLVFKLLLLLYCMSQALR